MKENVIQESETCLEKQPLNDEMLERMNEWWREIGRAHV